MQSAKPKKQFNPTPNIDLLSTVYSINHQQYLQNYPIPLIKSRGVTQRIRVGGARCRRFLGYGRTRKLCTLLFIAVFLCKWRYWSLNLFFIHTTLWSLLSFIHPFEIIDEVRVNTIPSCSNPTLKGADILIGSCIVGKLFQRYYPFPPVGISVTRPIWGPPLQVRGWGKRSPWSLHIALGNRIGWIIHKTFVFSITAPTLFYFYFFRFFGSVIRSRTHMLLDYTGIFL